LDAGRGSAQKKLVLAFADKYGDILAQPQEGRFDLLAEYPVVSPKHALWEQWRLSIQRMRRALALWDAMNDPERHKALQRLFTRGPNGIMYTGFDPGGKGSRLIAKGCQVSEYPTRDIYRMARRALQLDIHAAISDTATPSHSTPSLTADLRPVMLPVNLLASMWLTFARVASGEIEERRCAAVGCSEFVYIGSGPGLQNAHTLTHSAACRQRESRRKRLNTSASDVVGSVSTHAYLRTPNQMNHLGRAPLRFVAYSCQRPPD
jgi:hypothetical protein